LTPFRPFPILGAAPLTPEGCISRRSPLALLLIGSALACADRVAPELNGLWGGPDATLILSPTGGTVQYACGAGTIDPGWQFTANGQWRATGQYFTGGGPMPVEGRPPQVASYLGTRTGDTLTFSVTVPGLGTVLGPCAVKRDQPGASEICL
jgi:hypothetical protein